MPDTTTPEQAGALQPPPRESVTMAEAPKVAEDVSVAERTFETRATRLKLSEEEHADLAQLLTTVLDAIKREREAQAIDENCDLWEDLYFGVLQDRPAGQANIHVPIAQEVVDTALAVVEQALFSSRPWLQVQPREAADVDQAKRKEQFLDFALTVPMAAKDRLDPVLWEAAALGTGVSYLPWLREHDRIRDEETYDGLSSADMARFVERYPDAERDSPDIVAKLRKGKRVTLTVEYNEPRYDDPDLQFIPVRDWLVRPAARWYQLHRERFVGHRFMLRFADIEELVNTRYYDDRLSRLSGLPQEDGTVKDDPAFRDKPYEVAVGILRWKRPGDARERRYLVEYHAESRTVLRALHYPYWHNRINYIPWYFQRSRRSIYGVSLIQKVESSQFEVNAAHSLTLDAVAFGALPMFAARKSVRGEFNPMADGMYAGKTWYFDNPESDVKRFDAGVNAGVNVLLNLEDRAARHAELASGSSQNLTGLESARDPDAPGNKTAQLIQQAYVRIGKYLSVLSWSLSELGFQVCELYYQFSPTGRMYRVMGPEGAPVFEQITRQELRLRADFFPHGSTAALNPERQKREVLQMVELLMKSPDIAQSALKRWALIEMALDVAGSDWEKHKGKLLPSAEEVSLLRDEQQQALQQRKIALTAPPMPPAGPGVAPPTGGAGAPRGLPPELQALLSGASPAVNGGRVPTNGMGGG